MKLHDESLENLIRIAEDAVREGEYPKATKLIESALLEEPGYPKLHYTLAWMYHYHLTNESLAERHYQLAIYFDPTYEEAYELLSDFYLKNKKYKELIALLKKAETIEEIDKDFVFEMLGKVEEKLGNYANAIGYYRKALMNCVDNYDTKELKQNIRRVHFKRIKTLLKK